MAVETPEKAAQQPKGLGVVGWLRWIWRTLTSMKTALILLFLFALASIPGSLVPQRGVEPEKVAQIYQNDPALAEWYERLSLFDVFTSPWFAAIYLLLFTSLIGCIIPRTLTFVKELRRRPPEAPRNLSRLPHHAPVDVSLEEAARRLRKLRFRVQTGDGWVSAEKGFLRETGNLLFHVSLLGLLVAVGIGSLYGYRGNVLVVEGDGFANTVATYDRFIPGSQVNAESLEPFWFTLDDFKTSYSATGQELDYSAFLKVNDTDDYELKVNEPLEINGTQTYLIGHGYAPIIKVTDGKGDVVADRAVPCLILAKATLQSECVVKLPDAQPSQLGLYFNFLPSSDGHGASYHPAALEPELRLMAVFSGDLGARSGIPASVYQIAPEEVLAKMKRSFMGSQPLKVGDSFSLPDGTAKVEFTGVREWMTLQIAYDPGRTPALVSAVLAVVGIVLSLMIRRRRVFVRAGEVGALTRTEGSAAGFAEEFSDIVKVLSDGDRDVR
ncbi:cytochrome c biogenesis protein ResB [Nonomuraea soli]|uniref:Cytochrome c biogenesis protein n=1 Tax=Nonomuraea soli TaxID=1032476 RepID=A0A7W0CVE9_9ACTN|nr:cytochrome c biogenesis protein ResB [Nonomuraea soli]MBA2897905.1 cytochrome c biogenesis protein [Nonomuraea soli]